MRKERKFNPTGEGGPSWLVTFSDLMMTILIIFIVLLSFSSFSEEDLQTTVESFKDRPKNEFSHSADEKVISEEENAKLQALKKIEENEQEILSFVKTFSKENGLENELVANRTSRGIELVLPERMLFSSGQANLINESKTFLSEISPLLAQLENQIIVEGHTDNVPNSNANFSSNWHLSTARAIGVIDFLTIESVDASRFVAVGYGEYQPIGDNTTVNGRKKNRRVVIILPKVEQ